MNLGFEESFEVWFLPANVEAYSPRMLQEFPSADAAREYVEAEAGRYAGDLQMVRVTTCRQQVA